ncbi:acyl-ACP--UDP-N-acetylglucosamine O-acyltransferase [Candidatus Omnitrophota bacterium]
MTIEKKSYIHPTAIVEDTVCIDDNVQVGPYCVIKGNVQIGKDTILKERVSIEGNTIIGENNIIFAGAVIGSVTQDKKFSGGASYLRIGNNNKIREYVTINPGTENGTETVIGNDNLLMAYSHVAHDCMVHNNVTLANVATLAGHVTVEDRAIIGGLSAVHQFVRIGKLAIIGGCSKVVQDVPPFTMADGHPVKAFGINSVGLDRNDFPKEEKAELKRAYKIIFRSKLSNNNAVEKLKSELQQYPSIQYLILFLEASSRGVCR